MKKSIIGVAALLIIAGVCAPFVNGIVMEKVVTQSQDNLNAMYADTGSGVTFEIMNYDRKFSTSEIEWSIKLGNLAAVYGVDEILLVDKAKHGYTGIVSTTSLERNPWFVQLVNEKLDGKNPLNITTTYNLFGQIESLMNIDGFSIQVDNDILDVRPGKIITRCDEGFTHLYSDAVWGGFSVPGKVGIANISMLYDLDKISTYIWDGEFSLKAENVKINDQQKNLEISSFTGSYNLGYNKNNNTLSTGGELAIDTIFADNKSVKDTYVRLDISNIDAQGYEDFMKVYTRIVNSVMDDIGTAQESPGDIDKAFDGKMAATGLQMMAAYEKFLKKGLEIKISDLHAELPEGKITGNFELALIQDITFAQLAPIAMQPNMAFDIISLQTDFSIPVQLAGDDTSRLVLPVYPGMETGLFVQEGEHLVHNAQTKDGKLFLNGNEVVFN